MKILFGLAAACAALGGLATKADEPLIMLNPYIGGGIGTQHTRYDAKGVENFGFGVLLFNFGDESDNGWTANVTAGYEDLVRIGPVGLRVQAEAFRMQPEQVTSEISFDPLGGPFVPSGIQNVTRIDQSFGTNFSLWLDYRPLDNSPLVLSLGAGAGLVNLKMQTADVGNPNQFIGSLDKTQLTLMVGAQAGYEVNDLLTLGVEGRFTDFGRLDIPMRRAGNNEPVGFNNIDMETWSVMGFVRVDLNQLETFLP